MFCFYIKEMMFGAIALRSAQRVYRNSNRIVQICVNNFYMDLFIHKDTYVSIFKYIEILL